MEISISHILKNRFIVDGEGFVKQHSGNYLTPEKDGNDIEGYVAEGWVITKLGYMIYSYHRSNVDISNITLSVIVNDKKYETSISDVDDPNDLKVVNICANRFIEEILKKAP